MSMDTNADNPQPTKAAMKRCNKCGDTKAITAFGYNRSTKDGRCHYCRGCQNQCTHKSRQGQIGPRQH